MYLHRERSGCEFIEQRSGLVEVRIIGQGLVEHELRSTTIALGNSDLSELRIGEGAVS